jgi:hypothetical protein
MVKATAAAGGAKGAVTLPAEIAVIRDLQRSTSNTAGMATTAVAGGAGGGEYLTLFVGEYRTANGADVMKSIREVDR